MGFCTGAGLRKMVERAVMLGTQQWAAASMQVSTEDLHFILHSIPTTRERVSDSSHVARRALKEEAKQVVEQSFHGQSFLMLPAMVWGIFWSNNPWLVMHRRQITTRKTEDVLLFMAGTFGELAVSVLLFQASGDSLSVISAEDCEVAGMLASLGAILFATLLTHIMAKIPTTLLSTLIGRSFVVVSSEDLSEWCDQVRVWQRDGQRFAMLTAAYVAAACAIISLFLANVSPMSAMQWIRLAITGLLFECTCVPFATACFLAMTCIAGRCILGREGLRSSVEKGRLSVIRSSENEILPSSSTGSTEDNMSVVIPCSPTTSMPSLLGNPATPTAWQACDKSA